MIAPILSAQNWTSVKETNINVNNAVSVDIFTNKYGNHIIVQGSDDLKYYNMNLSGSAGSAIDLDTKSVVTPSISGDATKLYVVYRRSDESFIRTQYSSNGGANWSDLSNLNSNGSYIESVFSNNKLHITFEVSNVVYHAYYNAQNSTWSSPAKVSTNENGNYPRIAAWYTSSEDKVYFFYSNTSSVKKWREYNVTSSSWGNINQAFNIDYSWIMGLSVDATYIYFVLSYLDMNPPYDNKLMFYTKNRSTNNYVSSFEEISNWGLKCYNTVTTDGESHIPVYWYYSGEEEYYVWGIYRKKGTANPYNWDQIFTYTPPQPPTVLNVSSSSNDVHVIWKDNLGNNNGQNLRYKYDDQAPLAPQEFVISQSSNAHPLLSWSENNEIDIDFYVIEKILGESGWQPIDSTTIPYYEDVSETYCTGRWCDGGHYVWYRVKAVDYHPNESLPSEELSTSVNGFDPYKINHGVRIPSEYTLEQNYPNPFNPTTKITYLLPKEGLVTIKVYDVLGNEVAVLVNEIKPEGNYEVEFNASNLPSGVYFYKMQSGKFTEINKMILMR